MKEKLLKGRMLKKVVSFVLALAMVLSLMPSMSMEVKADEDTNYLTFTAEEARSTVTLNYNSGSNVMIKVSSTQDTIEGTAATSTDWQSYNKNTTIVLTNVNDTVSFKGTGVTTDGSNHFTMTGKIAASGSVGTLGSCGNRSYESMFEGCTSLTKAPTLPATTLAEFCYWNMFKGCTSLEAAPTLPATKLAK